MLRSWLPGRVCPPANSGCLGEGGNSPNRKLSILPGWALQFFKLLWFKRTHARSIPDQSQIIPRSFPDQSQINPRSFPDHSQITIGSLSDLSDHSHITSLITPKSLSDRSQIIPRSSRSISDRFDSQISLSDHSKIIHIPFTDYSKIIPRPFPNHF